MKHTRLQGSDSFQERTAKMVSHAVHMVCVCVSPPTNPHLGILFVAAMLLCVILIDSMMCIGYNIIKYNNKW
jgi:hypothetical protein